MDTSTQPRILVIDSYDSFTFNLAALVLKATPNAKLYIIKNDELPFDELSTFLPYFSAVIVGPGPGSPLYPNDVGVVKHLWHVASDILVPIFGVCLGLQSLAVEHGATLKRLNVVKHGQVSAISHHGAEIFEDVPNNCLAVRYHSLHVDITNATAKLEELAWSDDGMENGRVVMGLRHKFKPFWAVQYHPESVCTDSNGVSVIQNFCRLATRWWASTKKTRIPWDRAATEKLNHAAWPHRSTPRHLSYNVQKLPVCTRIISHLNLSSTQVAEALGVNESRDDFILLDSASSPGRYCIIGSLHKHSQRISYHAGDSYLVHSQFCDSAISLESTDFWTWMSRFMTFFDHWVGDPRIPFWGGFVGYINYELAVKELQCGLKHRDAESKQVAPDANLVFVERSVVIDNHTGNISIQSLSFDDDKWIEEVACALERTATVKTHSMSRKAKYSPEIQYPDRELYISRVKLAQEYLFAGESYELCLTARTHIKVPKDIDGASSSSWELYKRLKEVNPAPYAAYLRLGSTTLASSSPERFLSYSRPPNQKLQLRPIKGTVRKGADVTFQEAERILRSPKEIGENLMIVDLIRHDLHGVVGQNVECEEFCSIEEYETLWQMVSVIEGEPSSSTPEKSNMQLGWEMLQRSLPPGSMTGAPKKRSVQILQDLEDDERDLYSGVVGYWDVGGAGDWSVVIRSCFKHDERVFPAGDSMLTAKDGNQFDEWVLGSGGAITALSDPVAEWEEMMVKLKSVVRAFNP
ncbi:para-aminobenzoate synthase [Schizopora paradoxa]|uniref:aminodeoxychorismate synthase n=1 Tax=Schizopora paradoxa TaxID=27342 RepID=A0A0H2S838_9AGAM|nr:para-aminobenzoate synthase [Schizopora paradoxa]